MNTTMIAIIYFLGASIGSFLYVVVRRTIQGRDWVMGRSICEGCSRELEWFELIPTFSFIFLLGKCRKCGKKIDTNHFIVETYMGTIFTLLVYTHLKWGMSFDDLIVNLLLHSVFWITAVVDMEFKMINVRPIQLMTLVGALLLNDVRLFIIIGLAMFALEYSIDDNMKWIGAGDLDILLMVLVLSGSFIFTLNTLVNASMLGVLMFCLDYIEKKHSREMPFVPLLYFGFVLAQFNIGLY